MMRHQLRKTIGAVVLSATALLPLFLQAEDSAASTEKVGKILSFSKESTHKTSLDKIEKIKELLEIYVQRQEDLSSRHVIIRLEREIAREIPPLTPYKKLVRISEQTLEKDAEDEIKKLYEEKEYFARITKAATREAEKRYPLYKVGEKIKINYKQGHHNYEVSGVFYESNTRYVQIGDRQVPVNRLSPEMKLRFNPVANAEARKEYIQHKLRILSAKQLDDTQKMFDKKLLEIDALNEKNGYIFNTSTQSWMTAKEYLASLLGPALQKQQEVKKALEEKAKQRAIADQKKGTYSDEEYNAVREKLIAAQKKVMETSSGIDGDPGYEGIGWDTAYSDIRVILSRAQGLTRNTFITPKTEEEKKMVDMDGEILKYAEGLPSTVYFYFVTNKDQVACLYKVDFIYGSISAETLNEILTDFAERFGKSAEGEKESEKDLVNKVVQTKNTNQQQFHWTGKTTKAVLNFTYDPQENTFKDVHFIKEKVNAQ